MRKPVALTSGDPAGVGPEVALQAIRELGPEAAGLHVLGPAEWVAQARQSGCSGEVVGPPDAAVRPGAPNRSSAEIALAALERGAAGCRDGDFAAVVTGPVAKAALQEVGFVFPGQTEFFAHRWGGEPVMAFAGGRLRVVLATWHLPLAAVPSALDRACLARAIRAADELGRRLVGRNPRIGVCGLNPHAGEGGILGTEERDVIDPILDDLRAEFPALSRTQPGDTVFFRALDGEFDVVVALYHDQGLGPVKTLEFDAAVNVTLGLPWVRTSPDHGTGFGIAGKGVARHASMANAIHLARQLMESTPSHTAPE